MKRKITNTVENDPIINLFIGLGSGIEAQEAQGQRELVESSQLPRKWSMGKCEVQEQYKKMGIKIIDESEGDDLFFNVELPEGWKLKSTDHSMWNELHDNNGRVRATIFYKAAFYDREAFINFNNRYSFYEVCDEYRNHLDSYESIKLEKRRGEVKDCDTIIYETKYKQYKTKHTEKNHEKFWEGHDKMKNGLRAQAEKWLKKRFPDHEDINAYWN
jgi:hypothetical protein